MHFLKTLAIGMSCLVRPLAWELFELANYFQPENYIKKIFKNVQETFPDHLVAQ